MTSDHAATERACISAMMVAQPADVLTAAEVLRPADFSDARYSFIFRVILEVAADGYPAEPMTVAAYIDREHGALALPDARPLLLDLFGSHVHPASLPPLAQAVAENAIRRHAAAVVGTDLAATEPVPSLLSRVDEWIERHENNVARARALSPRNDLNDHA